MAKVIEFYVPKNSRKPLKCAPQLQCGKVIEFCSPDKEISLAATGFRTDSGEANEA